MNRVAIFGNMGFLGSLLSEYLACSGYTILGVDNFTYHNRHVAERLVNMFGKSRYQQYELDATTDFQEIRGILNTADYVFPLWAYVGMPLVKKYPEEARRVNVDSIKFIIDNLYNDQKVIGFNTNSGLGNSVNGVADETSPMNPVSEYAKQKCEAEKIIMSYPNSVGFRLATCYGLTWRTRLDLLVNTICWEAYWEKKVKLYEGEYSRNYISVNDVARACGFAMEEPNFEAMRGEIFNLGNDAENCTKRQLCHKIQKYIPFEIIESDEKDADLRDYKVSSQKLYNLGFKPRYSINHGIEDLLDWFKTLPTDKLDREAYVKYNVNTSI